MHLYEQYLAGDFEAVWRKLARIDSQTADRELRLQAVAVAKETMKRVAHNLGLLIPRLREIGFDFHRPQQDGSNQVDREWLVYSPPSENIEQMLQTASDLVGGLPLSLKAWYENVGDVCLMGDHPELCNYERALDGWDHHSRKYCDPLVMYPLHYGMLEFNLCRDKNKAQAFLFPLSPDIEFKHGEFGAGWEGVITPTTQCDFTYTGTGGGVC